MSRNPSRRSTTYANYRGALKDLDDSLSEFHVPPSRPLAHVFMRYWDPNDAAGALIYLNFMEIRTKVRMLQQVHGCWRPPPEVSTYLKKHPKPMGFSKQSNTKEERNLKLVLHILGVSPHDNRPFKEFLKAKTIRQRRYWLYKHLGPIHMPLEEYREPICETRLKRLYRFFPDRFKDEDGTIYFNNKMLLYDEASNLFFFGTRPFVEHYDYDSDSSFDIEDLRWKSD